MVETHAEGSYSARCCFCVFSLSPWLSGYGDRRESGSRVLISAVCFPVEPRESSRGTRRTSGTWLSWGLALPRASSTSTGEIRAERSTGSTLCITTWPEEW